MRMTFEDYMDEIWNVDTAFIGVDLQNDFGHKKGSLYVEGGEDLVAVINQVVCEFSEGLVFWTKDAHPKEHCSFVEQGGPWPIHCVKGKWGYNFMRGLDIQKEIDIVILKGEDADVDSYSAFFDNEKKKETGLNKILVEEEVKKLFIIGLATDVCVLSTVIDAIELGYEVSVYLPGCRGVGSQEDIDASIKKMEDNGAIMIEDE